MSLKLCMWITCNHRTYFRLIALESMCFINHQDCPINGSKTCCIDRNQLIAGEQHIKLDSIWSNPRSSTAPHCTFFKWQFILTDHGPGVLISNVGHYIEIWSPRLKFTLPINNGWERYAELQEHNQMFLQTLGDVPTHSDTQVQNGGHNFQGWRCHLYSTCSSAMQC